MGEYFKSGIYEVKLGTCEDLMYVRRDELEKQVKVNDLINEKTGNLRKMSDYLDLEGHWIYRFPCADEDNQTWKDASNRNRKHIEFIVNSEFVKMPHDNFMQTEINGVTFNLPFCPMSEEALNLKVHALNMYHQIKIKIVGERYNPKNPEGYTLFECAMCGSCWACSEEELPYIQEGLRRAGYAAEAERVKDRKA